MILKGPPAEFSHRVESAKRSNQVLRYAAVIEPSSVKVGLIEVDSESPLGRLSGTDNLVQFSTDLFAPQPLVLQGAGAGMDLTAAGVLSDLVELHFTRW